MSSSLDARLQRSLGDAFVIERELGGGGMARVFLATEHALGRRVVVKVLDLEGSVDASADRFRREIRVIAQLQHPHIVPIHTAGGDGTLLWYVMPYVAGESLRARLVREGALPLADALRIAREMLDALAAAHEHGVVHRDVKPENILLEGRHAVVADFGVAKALADAGVSSGSLTGLGIALGTPAYMAPEQALADPTTNHRADLYAAGVVLYEMLAGAPPYTGSAQAVMAAHMSAAIPRIEERRSDVPPAVAALVTRLLAKNAAERPQSALEVATALEAAATPTGTVAALPASSAAAGSTGRRGMKTPALRRAAVAVGFIVIAGAASAVWLRAGATTPMVAEADVIAVMPLGSTGDTATLRLGRDLVVTVSANLDGVGSLRAVDAMTVLHRVAAMSQPVPLDEARRLGAQLGARSVLHGSLVREGGSRVRAELALYPVDSGAAIARFSLLGNADSLRTLTDSISAQLLRAVWRRGQPPSPLLSEVATANGEALRAFLEGERAFGMYATEKAIEAYQRAVQSDSMFAQAWLRLDYMRQLALLPPDSMYRRKLAEQAHRLPPRDRDLLTLRHSMGPVAQRVDSGRALAARYPDYHTAQYQVGDQIIHLGPVYGIPIREAIPYLDRLEVLAPAHADNALHRMYVYQALGDTARFRRAALDLQARSTTHMKGYAASAVRSLDARVSGRRQPAESLLADKRDYLSAMKVNPLYGWFAFDLMDAFGTSAQSEEQLALYRRSNIMASHQMELVYSEGSLDVRRGNVARGLERLAHLETAPGDIPPAVRLAAARVAAQSAWLDLVPVDAAAEAVSRARSRIDPRSTAEQLDLGWAEGVIAIVRRDSIQLERALATLNDTTRQTANVRRGLRALWRERQTGMVDSLIAAEDEAMAISVRLYASLPLHRNAIARHLMPTNPARAEHYLQWTDAAASLLRSASVFTTMTPYALYDRGLAQEALGDTARAILYLERFVDAVDRPPPSWRNRVADAKARLARLGGIER